MCHCGYLSATSLVHTSIEPLRALFSPVWMDLCGISQGAMIIPSIRSAADNEEGADVYSPGGRYSDPNFNRVLTFGMGQHMCPGRKYAHQVRTCMHAPGSTCHSNNTMCSTIHSLPDVFCAWWCATGGRSLHCGAGNRVRLQPPLDSKVPQHRILPHALSGRQSLQSARAQVAHGARILPVSDAVYMQPLKGIGWL